MKRLLSLCLTCAALFVFATAVWAQQDRGGQGSGSANQDRTGTGTESRESGNTMEGTIVSVDTTGNKLVFRGREGAGTAAGTTGGTAGSSGASGGTAGKEGNALGQEHSLTVAPDARITCDGKECKLDDLKPGMKIRVTPKSGDRDTVTKIEALKDNTDFGNRGR